MNVEHEFFKTWISLSDIMSHKWGNHCSWIIRSFSLLIFNCSLDFRSYIQQLYTVVLWDQVWELLFLCRVVNKKLYHKKRSPNEQQQKRIWPVLKWGISIYLTKTLSKYTLYSDRYMAYFTFIHLYFCSTQFGPFSNSIHTLLYLLKRI